MLKYLFHPFFHIVLINFLYQILIMEYLRDISRVMRIISPKEHISVKDVRDMYSFRMQLGIGEMRDFNDLDEIYHKFEFLYFVPSIFSTFLIYPKLTIHERALFETINFLTHNYSIIIVNASVRNRVFQLSDISDYFESSVENMITTELIEYLPKRKFDCNYSLETMRKISSYLHRHFYLRNITYDYGMEVEIYQIYDCKQLNYSDNYKISKFVGLWGQSHYFDLYTLYLELYSDAKDQFESHSYLL